MFRRQTTSPEYETEQELARRTGTAADTWAKRRRTGNGPPYLKIGKSVRYRITDVDAWLASCQRLQTRPSKNA
jgi:predicted DNA-binding transcriptional regulator AlpA